METYDGKLSATENASLSESRVAPALGSSVSVERILIGGRDVISICACVIEGRSETIRNLMTVRSALTFTLFRTGPCTHTIVV